MPIDTAAAWLIPGIGLASGLIAACVSLQNRALLAEVREELAEVENRITLRLNGICIRRSECELHKALIEERIEAIAGQQREAAGGGPAARQAGGDGSGQDFAGGSVEAGAARPGAAHARAESGVAAALEAAPGCDQLPSGFSIQLFESAIDRLQRLIHDHHDAL